jgi:site-specific recombinase XerD
MAVYKKGNNWYIDYYLKGERKRQKIGPSKKLALQVLEDVHVKIAKGEYLGVYEEKKISFQEYAKEYLEYSKANKAVTSYKRDITSLTSLTAVFGTYYLFEIEPFMVEKYKAGRLQDGVEPASVNREIACLRHMCNKAVEWGYGKKNPVNGVKLLKEPPGRIRFLEAAEIDKLLQAVDGLKRGCGRYLRPVVVLALNTGLRKNEILQLKWKDIDLKEKKITVKRTKNNEIRTVPINDTLYQELVKVTRHPEGEYIFCDKSGIPYGNVRKSFESALEVAKIEDFHFHDLRHTFASHLVMKGCDLRTVQQLMGHKDIKMTMRYSHLSKAHLQEAVSKLDSLWTPYGHQRILVGETVSLSH